MKIQEMKISAVLTVTAAALCGVVVAQNSSKPLTPSDARDASTLPTEPPAAGNGMAVKPGYEPSAFPNVMVRAVPPSAVPPEAKANGGVITPDMETSGQAGRSGAGWVYVKPGATPPASRAATRSTTSGRSFVKNARDGVQLNLGEGDMSESVAHIGADGKVAVKCAGGTLCNHPAHKATAASQHANKSKAKTSTNR